MTEWILPFALVLGPVFAYMLLSDGGELIDLELEGDVLTAHIEALEAWNNAWQPPDHGEFYCWDCDLEEYAERF